MFRYKTNKRHKIQTKKKLQGIENRFIVNALKFANPNLPKSLKRLTLKSYLFEHSISRNLHFSKGKFNYSTESICYVKHSNFTPLEELDIAIVYQS